MSRPKSKLLLLCMMIGCSVCRIMYILSENLIIIIASGER